MLFVLATEHSLLRMFFLNIWRQILFPDDPPHASLYNFCTIEFGTFDCPRGLQLPARLSNYQCTFTKLQSVFNLILSGSKSILFVLTVVYEQCYDQ